MLKTKKGDEDSDEDGHELYLDIDDEVFFILIFIQTLSHYPHKPFYLANLHADTFCGI
jgi:hypothetical protein